MGTLRSFAVELEVGDQVAVGRGDERVVLTLLEKSGRRARIGFEADKSVPVNKVSKVASGVVQARKGLPPR